MNELIIDETEEQRTFQKYQLVWAKILGWPWWPGKIAQIPSEKNGNYRVQFFADTSHAYLPIDKLTCFIQGRDRHSTPKGHYRNFAKALAMANKMLQSRHSVKQEAQSECTSRDKLPPQQIQIINNSQQANPEPQSQNQNILEAQQHCNNNTEVRQPIQRTKKLFKRREIVKHHIKSQKNLQNQEQITSLLKNYQLDHVMEKVCKNKQFKGLRKSKLIRKNLLEKESQNIRRLTSRLICKALKSKQIALPDRHRISTCLMSSLLENNQIQIQGAHRALFQWIRCNQAETILKNYQTWPTDSKSDHFTDCS